MVISAALAATITPAITSSRVEAGRRNGRRGMCGSCAASGVVSTGRAIALAAVQLPAGQPPMPRGHDRRLLLPRVVELHHPRFLAVAGLVHLEHVMVVVDDSQDLPDRDLRAARGCVGELALEYVGLAGG